MSTPMHDMPAHLMIPVTIDGDGPAEDADHYACSCGCPNSINAEVHALAERVRSMMRALVLDGHATPQGERVMTVILNLHDPPLTTTPTPDDEDRDA